MIRIGVLIFICATLISALPPESRAQVSGVYSTFHNGYTFERDGQTYQGLRIPVYITLRPWEPRQMGLRLRLAATFAVADIFDVLEQDLQDIRVLTFVPGIEFVIPVGAHHKLRPFLDIGGGTNDSTNSLNLLADVGMRTELIFPTGKFVFGMEPGVRISYSGSSGGIRERTIFNPLLTLTARRVLGFQMLRKTPDLEAYFEAGYDFQTFEFASITSDADEINQNYEVGIGFGFSHGRPRIGPFRIPRLRIGYRFGDLTGFRIRLGGDWLTNLPEP